MKLIVIRQTVYIVRHWKTSSTIFKFPERNRCLVSATIRPFSDPRLADLPLIDVKYEQFIRRPIEMIRSTNIPKTVATTLERTIRQYPEDKIVVAYNTVSSMRIIIELLPDELKESAKYGAAVRVNSRQESIIRKRISGPT